MKIEDKKSCLEGQGQLKKPDCSWLRIKLSWKQTAPAVRRSQEIDQLKETDRIEQVTFK
jgi:hypothetical protein